MGRPPSATASRGSLGSSTPTMKSLSWTTGPPTTRPRSRGGAYPWLQHGVPEGLSGRDRGVRPAVPDGWRRRGCVLAATRVWLEPRLQPSRAGLAPPPEFRAHLLEAADRLRPRGAMLE